MENKNLIKIENNNLKILSDALSITNKLVLPDSRNLRILYLDDHLIFSRSITSVIHRKFPNATFKYLQDGNIALESVFENLKKGNEIDLIITDINHPGIRGIEFCDAIREKEKVYFITIPILFITMVDEKYIKRKAESYTSVIFLNKCSTEEEIILAITNLI